MPAPQVIRSIVARRGADRGAPQRSPIPGREVFLRIVFLAAGVRLALYVIGLAALWAAGNDDVWARSLDFWVRWDAPHYLRLADVGYRSTGEDALFIVFYPGYPLAVRIVALVFRDLVLSGLVASFLASVGAAWLLYRLVRLDEDHDAAWRAVLVLFSFPTAYYLSVPYTESLFLLAIVGAMYAARTQRWARAGLSGLVATATRVAGLAVLPALLVESWRGPAGRWRRLVLALVAAGGAVCYLALNQAVFGDPLHFLSVQRGHWSQQLVPPWEPFVDAVRQLVTASPEREFRIIFAGRVAATLFAVAVLVWGRRTLRPADRVYGWTGLVLVMSPSWLISLPRYLLGIYPIFVVLGVRVRRKGVLVPVLTASAAAQAYFFSLYVRGGWTF